VDAIALARLLAARGRLERRRSWSPEQLASAQSAALRALREHALRRSPFYREFHRGLEDAPLMALPVLTKAHLMDQFDDVVADRRVRRADIERYLEGAGVADRYLDRYRVAMTGGTSGRRGIFLSDPDEWTQILASYGRAYAWAGVAVGLRHRLPTAIVSSRVPTHQSSLVGATARNPLLPTLRLDARDPLTETVASLNGFRPATLVGYASILAELAAEQAAGRLRIAPRAVFSASEPLTTEVRAAATAAWGVTPFNVYAATEAAGIASECEQHHMHVYADLVITEVVDEDDRPVPAGTTGAKLLITVLFSRSQPLIRYELTDRVRVATTSAGDIGPFSEVLDAVEGRTEEVLALHGASGPVRVHPNLFHVVLEPTGAPWQVVQRPDALEILVAGEVDNTHLEARVTAELARLGAAPIQVTVRRVPAIPRTTLGKTPLVRRAG
jgi:phenylacetate-coenzyme A ligase PaaK-like adenylate-forming protein